VFALAWDLVGGQMGYNSFGNVLFVGLGMYVSAIVQIGLFYDVGLYTEAKGGGTEFLFDARQFLTGLAFGLPAAALVSALAAWLLGSLVLSMRGHYFAICTLGLGIATGQVAAGIPWIGAGSGMLTPNPPPDLGDVGLLLYYLALLLAVACTLTFAWLLSTRFGLALNAIRDDEDKAESMGLKTHAAKVAAWAVAAAFLGIAGAIYGNLLRFIDPVETAFAGPTLGRLDDPHGAARRQGDACRAYRRRHRVPIHQGAVLDLSARLAKGRARRADRGGRRVLPLRYRGLRQRPDARARPGRGC
jgi:branched-chain amino acid transport system permease protein